MAFKVNKGSSRDPWKSSEDQAYLTEDKCAQRPSFTSGEKLELDSKLQAPVSPIPRAGGASPYSNGPPLSTTAALMI